MVNKIKGYKETNHQMNKVKFSSELTQTLTNLTNLIKCGKPQLSTVTVQEFGRLFFMMNSTGVEGILVKA